MRTRPQWRKMSWAVLLWSLLTILAILAPVMGVHSITRQCVSGFRGCFHTTRAGPLIIVSVLVVTWVVTGFILWILWLINRATGAPARHEPGAAGERAEATGSHF